MPADDTSGVRSGPVVLRIKLRYEDLDAMVTRFAANVGKSGLFLPTRSIQPVGTEVKFELRLANDTPVLVGLGRVTAVREPDPANPRAAFGIALELMRVTREGRDVIMKMLERRKLLGLPEVLIPMPEDIDAARRIDVESGVVRDVLPAMASAPVGEQLLTSPRTPSGPIAITRAESGAVRAVAALGPEPARARRPRVSELIARAESAPIAVAMPELDEQVDVERALVRARALAAGADLDDELEGLRELAAAPRMEISVEAASAELARQLGGVAVVRKDRSQRWAPPPAVEIAAPSLPDEPPEPTREPEPPPAHEQAAAPVSDIAARFERDEVPAVPDQVITEPSRPAIEALPEAAPAAPEPLDGGEPQDEEEAELDESDLEPMEYEAAESTQIGEAPIDPLAFQQHVYPTVPDERLADQLDAHLAVAEAEAESDISGPIRDEASYVHSRRADFAEALAGGDDEPAGDDELAAGYQAESPGDDIDASFAPPEAPHEPFAVSASNDFDEEEISDLDVLAEADADDADLLSADGEADASHDSPAAPSEPPQVETPTGGSYDFAARLDLDDDAGPDPLEFEERHAGLARHARDLEIDRYEEELERRQREIEQARYRAPSYDESHYDPPSSSYTFAERPPDDGIDFDEPHAFSGSPQTPPPPAGPAALASRPSEPRLLGGPPRTTTADDLEHALSALDVDLDELSIPREDQLPPGARGARLAPAARLPARQPGAQPRPAPGKPARATPAPRPATAKPAAGRPATDDGVIIDFEDDD